MFVFYQVRSLITSIALFFVLLPAVAAPHRELAGTVVNTPPDMTYYAIDGDTLSSIAKRFTDKTANWIALAKRNKIENDRTIPVGTAILVPLELLPEEPSQAKVAAFTGEASAKLPDNREIPVELGAIYIEGTQITTGKGGFLSLLLPDNSRISLPSNSQVVLTKLRQTKFTKSPRTEISLKTGRVESKVSSLQINKGRFEVRSPLAIAGVRGTHFRVGSEDDKMFNEVLEGGVAVGNEGKVAKSQLVPAGSGNVVDNHGIGKPVALLKAPTLRDGYQVQERPTVKFVAQADSTPKAYHAQIARDEQAQNILMEQRVTQPQFKFDGLDDGQYFVRVSAIDTNGLEGIPATFPFTLQARPEPPLSIQPRAKLRVAHVEFGWSEAKDAKHYHLQVAKDAAFKEMIIDENALRSTEFATDTLPLGGYHWRVATVIEKNGALKQGPYGDVQGFVLLPVQTMSPVSDDGGNMLTLNWPSEPGQTFLVQIARDADFKNLYLVQETKSAELKLPRPDSGVYYVRVKATDPDGYVGAYSSPQKISIFSRWVTSSGAPLMSISGVVKAGY